MVSWIAMAWVRVDSPSAVAEAMANISHESLYQSAELIAFISSSPAWIYPVDRFFARALYGKWCMEHAGSVFHVCCMFCRALLWYWLYQLCWPGGDSEKKKNSLWKLLSFGERIWLLIATCTVCVLTALYHYYIKCCVCVYVDMHVLHYVVIIETLICWIISKCIQAGSISIFVSAY